MKKFFLLILLLTGAARVAATNGTYLDENAFVEAMLRMMEIFGLIDRDRLPLGTPYLPGYGQSFAPGLGLGGLPSGLTGMSPMSGLGMVPGLSPWSGLSGVPGMSTWSGVPGMSTWSGVPGMSTWGGVPGMSTWGGVPGMSTWGGVPGGSTLSGVPGMSAWSGSTGIPGMSPWSGMSGLSPLSGLGVTPGLSPFGGWTGVPGMSSFPGLGIPGQSAGTGVPGHVAGARTTGPLDGIWELNKGGFVIIRGNWARLQLSRELHQDFTLGYDRDHLWWAPQTGGETSRYRYQLRDGRMVLRDDAGNFLLLRRRR